MPYKRIYPPVHEIATLLYYTLGCDPNIRILKPKCEAPHVYRIGIQVAYREQADYIRIIVPLEYRSGNEVVYTDVFSQGEFICFPCGSQKNQRDVANVFCNALRTNPLFIGVVLEPQSCIPVKSTIKVCVTKGVVPRCGYDQCIADAFAEVVRLCYGVIIITEVIFCSCHPREVQCGCLYCKGCGASPLIQG